MHQCCVSQDMTAVKVKVGHPDPRWDVQRLKLVREAVGKSVEIQRQSDGTISLEGVRFEIPARFRHFRRMVVRYARWDLGRVDLVDPRSGTILVPIFPLDRAANADGRRSAIEPESGPDDEPDDGTLPDSTPDGGGPDKPLPSLLKRILDEYSASGMPPVYLPKKPNPKKGKES